MFAVIYRAYIKPGLEEDYQKLWKQIAHYFAEHRGAIGSCLHKTEDGIWLAYSRWPDKTTRDASWSEDSYNDLPVSIVDAIIKMKKCFDTEQIFPEICMDVMENLF